MSRVEKKKLSAMEGGRAPYNAYNDLSDDTVRKALRGLSSKEEDFMVPENSFTDENYKRERRYAVRFIENLSTAPRIFDALIPYTAMTYFDRYISRGHVFPTVVTPDSKNRDLFLTCCLILAWKIRTKTFSLSSFLRERNLHYTVDNVFGMETHICVRLEWKMLTLTPFYFIEYYIPIFRLPSYLSFPRRPVRQLIVKSQYDIAFKEYRPSVLAASAMLMVTSKIFPDRYDTFEHRMFISEFISPQKDMILKCKMELEPLYKCSCMPMVTDMISISIKDPAANDEGTSSAAMKPEEPKAAMDTISITIDEDKGHRSAAVEPEDEKGNKQPVEMEAAATDHMPIHRLLSQRVVLPWPKVKPPRPAVSSILAEALNKDDETLEWQSHEIDNIEEASRKLSASVVPGRVSALISDNDETPEKAETDNEEAKTSDNQAAALNEEGQVNQHDPGTVAADDKSNQGRKILLALMEASIPPVQNQVAIIEENRALFRRRAGKDPAAAAAEIQPIPGRHNPAIADHDDADEVMDFDLGWIEAQEEADHRRDDHQELVRAAAAVRADYGTYLVQMLTNCCTGFVKGCSIL